MSYIPDNPNYPFIKFGIGDGTQTGGVDLSVLPPEHIEEFNYERGISDESNVLELTVFDQTAIALEYLLKKIGINKKLYFQYGYPDGPQSKTYQVKLSEYTIDLSDVTGARLTLQARSVGVIDSISKGGKAKSYTGLISDIVKQIANEEGWLVKGDSIEPTEPVYGDDGKLKTFTRMTTMTAPVFINQVLSKYAVSAKDGRGDYKLYFDDTANDKGKSTVYYKPNAYNVTQDTTSLELPYQFKYGVGSNSTVINFEPDFKGNLTDTKANISADMLDRVKNSIITVDFSSESAKNRPTSGDAGVDNTLNTFTFAGSAYSKSELENIAATMWYSLADKPYTATLTIIGDPSIIPDQECSILYMLPNGVPHHSSGVYHITKVTDNISGGNYTTELALNRNALTVTADPNSNGINITVQKDELDSDDDNSDDEGSGKASNGDVEKAVQWMIGIANDNSHGYSQASRWGPDYDCSSLVISGYKKAGFNVGGATYTGNMRSVFTKAGFKWLPSPGDKPTGLKRGDICLNEAKHVECYIGGGKNVGAHSVYKHPETGDQTGKEIRVDNYWNDGWNGILRYDK